MAEQHVGARIRIEASETEIADAKCRGLEEAPLGASSARIPPGGPVGQEDIVAAIPVEITDRKLALGVGVIAVGADRQAAEIVGVLPVAIDEFGTLRPCPFDAHRFVRVVMHDDVVMKVAPLVGWPRSMNAGRVVLIPYVCSPRTVFQAISKYSPAVPPYPPFQGRRARRNAGSSSRIRVNPPSST